MREDAKKHGFFKGRNLDTYVEFIPVLYDDVFRRIVRHWRDLGEFLSTAVPVMPDAAAKALDAIQKADDDQWVIQSAGDVVLYWGFRLFQQRVVLRVLAQITRIKGELQWT